MLARVSSDFVLKSKIPSHSLQNHGNNAELALMEFTLKEETYTFASMVKLHFYCVKAIMRRIRCAEITSFHSDELQDFCEN